MKNVNTPTIHRFFFCIALIVTGFACQKEIDSNAHRADEFQNAAVNSGYGHLKQTKTFNSNVATAWLNQQMNMLRVPLAPGASSQEPFRALAYCGVALYESVVPGMPAYQSLSGQLNQLSGIPKTEPGKAYHWSASANAALAYMNRHLFPGASQANKDAMNTLEAQMNNLYGADVDAATLDRSIKFGQAVGEVVFNWAQTDGILSLPSPTSYQLPMPGNGHWEPTAPSAPANPFAHMRRLIVAGSNEQTTLEAPPAFSTDPNSAFYQVVMDVKKRLGTPGSPQEAAAIYHRDAPGYPGGASLVVKLKQVFEQADPTLDKAALAYAKLGIGSYDALTNCFVQKYNFLLIRPVTYIRKYIDPNWNPLFGTPNHPEYPSGHSVNGGVVSVMLSDVFGNDFSFTLDHYSYLNPSLPARHYESFEALGREMGDSRVWGGIHYQFSCDRGFWLGERVSRNILKKVRFLK